MDKLPLDPEPQSSDKTMSDYQDSTFRENYLSAFDRLERLEQRDEEQRKEIESLKKNIEDVKSLRIESEERHFKYYTGNMIMKMIDVIYETEKEKLPERLPSQSTERYIQAANQIERKTFEDCNLDVKYYDQLQLQRQRLKHRLEVAYNTEFMFAFLLLNSRDRHPERYDFWAELFPFCYGHTVEELARGWSDENNE